MSEILIRRQFFITGQIKFPIWMSQQRQLFISEKILVVSPSTCRKYLLFSEDEIKQPRVAHIHIVFFFESGMTNIKRRSPNVYGKKPG
jgi:hypothetical protein